MVQSPGHANTRGLFPRPRHPQGPKVVRQALAAIRCPLPVGMHPKALHQAKLGA